MCYPAIWRSGSSGLPVDSRKLIILNNFNNEESRPAIRAVSPAIQAVYTGIAGNPAIWRSGSSGLLVNSRKLLSGYLGQLS